MRSLFSNSWFAGFVVGDGYFAIAIPAASMEKAKGKATKCLWDRTIRKKDNYG
jgi:hypothetical protein